MSGISDPDSTQRAGSISDPHRSLTGALASLWRKYTIIKLLGVNHDLTNFDSNAFPHSNSNTDPKNPFQNLTENRSIVKVITEPLFCSASLDVDQCVPDDD